MNNNLLLRFDRDLLIIDTETTGVEDNHVICQWGSILLDRETLEEKSRLSTLVQITKNDLAAATPAAMAIHGLEPNALLEAELTFPELLDRIKETHGEANTYHLYGMGVAFDVVKLQKMCDRYELPYPFPGGSPAWCRTWNLGASFHVAGAILGMGWGNCGLRAMCDKFNIDYPDDHDAVNDCELLAEVLRRFAKLVREKTNTTFTGKAPVCDCGRPMALRKGGRSNSYFWGCTGYASGACKKTRGLGKKRKK